MAGPEQFSLRWNDFHSNLSQSFHALLEGEDLVDVTIAAGGQYVHAHKLILSVCSPYFKELFKMNPCDHPIVILKDVAHHELRQLLQFMYCGEVHVRQQELVTFLHTAELLQVKGLTGGRERSESPQPVLNDEPPMPTAPPAPEPAAESQPEWVPGGEDTIAMESVNEPILVPALKEETARSPLKRLLKNTPNKNNNMKKKQRSVNDSLSHAENTEYGSDGVQNIRTSLSSNEYNESDNGQNASEGSAGWRSEEFRDSDKVPNSERAGWRAEAALAADYCDTDNYSGNAAASDSAAAKPESKPETA